MSIRTFDATNASELFDHYLKNEAANNLQAGILNQLDRWEGAFVLALQEGTEVQGTLMHTMQFLLEAQNPVQAAVLAREAFKMRPSATAVQGPPEQAQAFVQVWERLSGRPATLNMKQRIYQLDRVEPLPQVPGQLRPMGPADRETIMFWARAFSLEAVGEPMSEAQAEQIASRSTVFVWEVQGKPVSMAATAGKTRHGVRINLVYTPPESRGLGYASALVSQLSQQLLDAGTPFCFLFTDLANPTSNRIYQRMGYRPVTDIDRYTL